jgi:uncharacterized OsmC-like protein
MSAVSRLLSIFRHQQLLTFHSRKYLKQYIRSGLKNSKFNYIVNMSKKVISSLKKEDKFLTVNKTADHTFLADEPVEAGGDNEAPDPVMLALGSLGACTVMTLKIYYEHKQVEWDQIDVHITTEVKRTSEDELEEHEKPYLVRGRIRYIFKDIHIKSNMDDKAFSRAADIASKCPVSMMMDRNALMVTRLHRV